MSDLHHIYYNRRGEPITHEQQMEEWKQSDFDWDKMKRVARQEQDDIVVSTVFLGLNHQAEALQGHEVAVTLAFGLTGDTSSE